MDFSLFNEDGGFDGLAHEWNALLDQSATNTPFLRHEYLQAWWKLRGGGEWPKGELRLILAREAGELVGIAPLFQDDERLMLIGSIEISDFLDVISSPDDLPEFLRGLLDFLFVSNSNDLKNLGMLDLYNLPESSPTVALLQQEAAQRGWQFSSERLHPAPYIPLPGNFDEYLAGINKKQRHEIRRKIRRIEEYGESVRWYIVEDASSLSSETEAFIALMATDDAKAGFLTSEMRLQLHAIIQSAFSSGWLQLAFLEVDGEKAAGYINFDYDNRIWVYNSGLDRRFMTFSPGWVILGYLLQWANENGRSEFDFMRGNEEYKYRFGGVDRFVVRATLKP